MRAEPERGRRLLTFASGGWVLLLAAILVAAAAVWTLSPAFRRSPFARGSRDPANGFDLSTCLVPRSSIVASGLGRDGIPSLDSPRPITAVEADGLRGREGGRYLVSSDLVVGVFLGGEARAYPLRVLSWHEIANDTLGGRPIAVTYNPLCGSVVVFDRRVGGDAPTFGVSGLLLDSNLLMYDRRSDPGSESLWSQLERRAVSGSAAASSVELSTLPFSLVPWSRWKERFPSTTVPRPDPAMLPRYASDPYGTYDHSARLAFPVRSLPPPGGLPLKARVLVLGDGRGRRVYRLDPETTRSPDVVLAEAGGALVELDYSSVPAGVLVRRAGDAPLEMLCAFWFAWYAADPASPGTIDPQAAPPAGHQPPEAPPPPKLPPPPEKPPPENPPPEPHPLPAPV